MRELSALVSLFVLSVAQGKNDNVMNKFICSQGKCIQASMNPSDRVRYDSLDLCRLICSGHGNLWPIPTVTFDLGHMVMEVDPSKIQVVLESAPVQTREYIRKISDIFFARLYSQCANTTTRALTSVHIHMRVISPSTELKLLTDESYKLSIKNYGKNIEVEINATTVFGTRHALETLLQLTATQYKNKRCVILMLTKADIKDRPVFRHRGLLIDTSRTFLPLADIERTIDGMSSVKLNVLHWHATDTHSFPLAFDTLPQLAELGAYSSKEVYTTKDMKHVIEYGKLRGVRVLLEIDSPGHAGNGWQFGEKNGLGKLSLCVNKEPWRRYCVQPPCGQMNPANPNLYRVLGQMYKEISTMFQQEMFHMGGDEVHLPCWMASDEVLKYMDEHRIPRTEDGYMTLWAEFHGKALNAWDRAVGHSHTRPVLWSSQLTSPERITDYLDPKRYIIETWADANDPLPEDLISKGYSVIYATRDVWYLDHGFWGQTTYHNWAKVYDYQIPLDYSVLGGEACMWGELASTYNFDMKVWPRAAALAERLWSSPPIKSMDAKYRLIAQVGRLFKLGINADQIMPEWCSLNEGRCE
ncbi:chitooligosaccharidolytic beta-N-acetylglucosaminidase [Cimex lectularius]|uniref:Beta-hexosaminidase n=1 Tax=Cimex lectularius TaxID=79782 RepID=A0A8I6RGB8_CIMLE|nr:chitooligosaccharidolytic beta-N-acetylglucosaminidase [Cimex lectularius]